MKPLYVLLVGVAVGWAASGIDWSREAVGQDGGVGAQEGESVQGDSGVGPQSPFPHSGEATATSTVTEGTIPAPPQKRMADWLATAQSSAGVNRFQISAYGIDGQNGCYIVDSTTGKLWHVRLARKPELVADKLPQQ